MQSADECECKDVLTTAGDLGELALKVADVRFKVITLFSLTVRRWWLFLITY